MPLRSELVTPGVICDTWCHRFDWRPVRTFGELTGTWLVAVPAALEGDEWVETVVHALGGVRLTVGETSRPALAER